jgi:glycosyltransferase involved in cell wall biosynthesis
VIVEYRAIALADAIKALIAHPEQVVIMSQAARQKAQTFDWSNAAAAYLQLYRGMA